MSPTSILLLYWIGLGCMAGGLTGVLNAMDVPGPLVMLSGPVIGWTLTTWWFIPRFKAYRKGAA